MTNKFNYALCFFSKFPNPPSFSFPPIFCFLAFLLPAPSSCFPTPCSFFLLPTLCSFFSLPTLCSFSLPTPFSFFLLPTPLHLLPLASYAHYSFLGRCRLLPRSLLVAPCRFSVIAHLLFATTLRYVFVSFFISLYFLA